MNSAILALEDGSVFEGRIPESGAKMGASLNDSPLVQSVGRPKQRCPEALEPHPERSKRKQGREAKSTKRFSTSS